MYTGYSGVLSHKIPHNTWCKVGIYRVQWICMVYSGYTLYTVGIFGLQMGIRGVQWGKRK